MDNNKFTKVLLHASAFFAPVLVPVILYIICTYATYDEEVRRLSIQALLFQLIMWVLIAISGFLSWILIGLPFLIVFSIMMIVVPIIGIVKALGDESWNYPIVGRWV